MPFSFPRNNRVFLAGRWRTTWTCPRSTSSRPCTAAASRSTLSRQADTGAANVEFDRCLAAACRDAALQKLFHGVDLAITPRESEHSALTANVSAPCFSRQGTATPLCAACMVRHGVPQRVVDRGGTQKFGQNNRSSKPHGFFFGNGSWYRRRCMTPLSLDAWLLADEGDARSVLTTMSSWLLPATRPWSVSLTTLMLLLASYRQHGPAYLYLLAGTNAFSKKQSCLTAIESGALRNILCAPLPRTVAIQAAICPSTPTDLQ